MLSITRNKSVSAEFPDVVYNFGLGYFFQLFPFEFYVIELIHCKGNGISCRFYPEFDSTSCFLEVKGRQREFELKLNGDKAGLDRVGEYRYSRPDINAAYFFKEVDNGTDKYWTVDSAVINISSSERVRDFSDSIRSKGEFKAWIHYGADSLNIKMLSGQFESW